MAELVRIKNKNINVWKTIRWKKAICGKTRCEKKHLHGRFNSSVLSNCDKRNLLSLGPRHSPEEATVRYIDCWPICMGCSMTYAYNVTMCALYVPCKSSRALMSCFQQW